jgi:hypothetical protein
MTFQRTKTGGRNPRALGTNPRSVGTNPRALGTNPKSPKWAKAKYWKRQQRRLNKQMGEDAGFPERDR